MKVLTLLLLALPSWAAISNVTVYAKSQTELCLSYDAPSSMATVTVEASLESDYTPLVDDLNTTYFANANSDLDRFPLWQNGTERKFCIGHRDWVQEATQIRWVGRGLESGRHYYIRLTSGGDQATKEADTLGLAFGDTSSMEVSAPSTVGFEGLIKSPTIYDAPRGTRFVDPKTGTSFYPVSRPGDNGIDGDAGGNQLNTTFNSAYAIQSATNWTNNAANVLTDNGVTDSVSTTDWLILRHTIYIYPGTAFDGVKVYIEGSGSDATANNRVMEVRLKFPGVSCDASTLVTKEVQLGTVNGVQDTGTTTRGDTWQTPGSPYQLSNMTWAPTTLVTSLVGSTVDVADDDVTWVSGDKFTGGSKGDIQAGMIFKVNNTPYTVASVTDNEHLVLTTATAFGTFSGLSGNVSALDFCIRKKTDTGSVTIDFIKYDHYGSQGQGASPAGNYVLCQDVVDGSGFFLCSTYTNGASTAFYKIKTFPATNADPDIRFLGRAATTGGATCVIVGYSYVTHGKYYCAPSTGNTLYVCDYAGDSTNKTAPYTAEADCSALSTNLLSAMDTFVDANIAHYPLAISGSFTTCSAGQAVFVKGTTDVYIEITCPRSSQNSMAWMGIWKVGTGIAAAYPTFANAYSRWCGLHSQEQIGNSLLVSWTSHFDDVNGPHSVTLNGAINNSTTSITLSGHPAFMNLIVGDVLWIQTADGADPGSAPDNEFVLITNVGSFPTVTVTRAIDGGTAYAHSNGDTAIAWCSSRQPSQGGTINQLGASMIVWDFIADPYGETTDNVALVNKTYIGHETCRLNHCVNNNAIAKSANGTEILVEEPDPTFDNSVDIAPDFASCVGTSEGLKYQTHPSWHNVLGGTFSKEVYADTRPKVGDPSWGGTWTLVAGQSFTYEAGTVTTCPRIFPTIGMSSFFNLRNISGPANCNTTPADENCISDSDPYTFCQALAANECVSGSSAGDLYATLSAAAAQTSCAGGEGSAAPRDICVMSRTGGTQSATEWDTTSNTTNSIELRDLLSVGAMNWVTWMSTQSVVTHLPDGSGILYPQFRAERYDMFLAKTPPVLVDDLDRTTFGSYSVVIPSGDVPAMTSRAVVRFGTGYQDFCSSNRAEDCYAVLGTLDETTPFRWETELTASSGVSCASGCTVIVPYLHNRIYWYEIIYRDSSGMELGSEPITLIPLNGEVVTPAVTIDQAIRGNTVFRGNIRF